MVGKALIRWHDCAACGLAFMSFQAAIDKGTADIAMELAEHLEKVA